MPKARDFFPLLLAGPRDLSSLSSKSIAGRERLDKCKGSAHLPRDLAVLTPGMATSLWSLPLVGALGRPASRW